MRLGEGVDGNRIRERVTFPQVSKPLLCCPPFLPLSPFSPFPLLLLLSPLSLFSLLHYQLSYTNQVLHIPTPLYTLFSQPPPTLFYSSIFFTSSGLCFFSLFLPRRDRVVVALRPIYIFAPILIRAPG